MIYLIYSLEKELIEKYIDKLIKKENIDENSVVKYSLENDNILDIIEECNTMGLFSIKKLIIVEATNAFSSKGKEITELNDYLDNYNKDVILVFTCDLEKIDTKKIDTRKKLYKKVSSVGKVESLNKDDNYIVNIINEKLKDYKMEDINYFIKVVGSNINNIENELEKLMNYKYNEKIITNSDIDSLCEVIIEKDIFALTNAIVKNDNNNAITLYRFFLNTKNPKTKKNYDVLEIITLLASQFRLLLQVNVLYNRGLNEKEITTILGVHPYSVKLAIDNIYSYDRDMLELYLIKLFELDKKIKLGLIDKNIFFELFILNKDI